MKGIWTDGLPPDDPIFSGGVRLGFGPKTPPQDEDDDLEFVSPSVPGRTVRMRPSPPAEESD